MVLVVVMAALVGAGLWVAIRLENSLDRGYDWPVRSPVKFLALRLQLPMLGKELLEIAVARVKGQVADV